MKSKIVKLLRFVSLYGIERTLVKTASRTKKWQLKFLILSSYQISKQKNISLIGCGQFGFSSISYFLLKLQGKKFLQCFDVLEDRADITAKFYGYKTENNVDFLLSNPNCNLVYIASNHFSHTPYALQALRNNKDIYIEKPVSVSKEQFLELKTAIENSTNKVFIGYNRPFSKAIREISSLILNNNKPISLNCFISGHVIDTDHWYRLPEEGTRICGNAGHWIDLMIHIMHKRGNIPTEFEISVLAANPDEIDDNLNISIRSDFNDITSIFITSRTEPIEGINETINIQCGDVIAKIDDFKRMTIWKNDFKVKRKYFRKDVGHKLAINQPFLKNNQLREWKEIETSTFLMLEITEMVKNNISKKIIIKQ